jgi:hypothetical protein
MLKAIIGLLLLAPLTLFAQGWLPMGARSNSMGNSSVTLTDVWAFHHNPGAIADLEKQAISISYENRFLLKELQSQGLVYGQPLKKGVLSFGAQTYGFKTYRTNRVGVGYSMKLSELFSAGVQLNYQNIRLTENYGSKNTVTAEVGILAKITEKWSIGVSAFNLGRNKLADFQDDRFTTLMRLGTSYKVSKKVLVTAEVEKNVDFALRAKAGVEYQLVDKFYLRGGFATQPIEASFGFGYKFSVFQLDFGSAYHQQLGWSPHFSFTYQHK